MPSIYSYHNTCDTPGKRIQHQIARHQKLINLHNFVLKKWWVQGLTQAEYDEAVSRFPGLMAAGPQTLKLTEAEKDDFLQNVFHIKLQDIHGEKAFQEKEAESVNTWGAPDEDA